MSITIKGLDRLYRKLDKVAATRTLVDPMNRAVLRVQREMQDYPPQAPGSAYVRTGTLGRRWTVRVRQFANGVEGRVGNRTSYVPWVHSHRFQARQHQGRWQTDQDVLDRERPGIVRDFQDAIDRALRD